MPPLRMGAFPTLSELALGRSALVRVLHLSEREAAWLRAVGCGEGTQVTVLRRAPLGGPLHVRTAGGTELAVDRELAGHVEVAEETPA